MSGSDRSFDRRSVLKTLGVGGVAAASGVGALTLATGPAKAKASLDVNISGTTYSGDQGVVDWVGVDAEKVLQWENYDVPVRAFKVVHEITLRNGTIDGSTEWHELYTGETGLLKDWSGDGYNNGWGGDGEYVVSTSGDKGDNLNGEVVMDVSWATISNGTHPSDYDSVQNPVDWADKLTVDADGATKKRTVAWRTTITYLTDAYSDSLEPVKDADGEQSVSGMEEFNVTVTNEPAQITGNTNGDSKAK